jgi:hypothetical protein
MIHYINGVPAKNIKINKAKRHALEHYRHVQLMDTLKDTAISFALVLSFVAFLAVIYLINN